MSFLKSIKIEPEAYSPLENDYLIAHEFYEAYNLDPSENLHPDGRIALGGLHELYKWIWSVKDKSDFNKLYPHLGLLVQASPKINAYTPMISNVTGKQDDKTNKFIEAIVGFFAVAYGSDVELDDPVKSSNGDNPDAIFKFQGQRISVACKTLRSNNSSTVLGNIESAAKQISRADCDLGYMLLNSMNILEHEKINNKVFNSINEPFDLLRTGLEDIYEEIMSRSSRELSEIFAENPRACPIVITVLHSTTRINSDFGLLSTSLKGTIVTNFNNKDDYPESLLLMPKLFNDFIHNISSAT